MQVYILMQSAGVPAGPFGQAAQNADERRRAVCRAALRVSSVSGVGAAVGVTVRPLAPPLGELLSASEAERASLLSFSCPHSTTFFKKIQNSLDFSFLK